MLKIKCSFILQLGWDKTTNIPLYKSTVCTSYNKCPTNNINWSNQIFIVVGYARLAIHPIKIIFIVYHITKVPESIFLSVIWTQYWECTSLVHKKSPIPSDRVKTFTFRPLLMYVCHYGLTMTVPNPEVSGLCFFIRKFEKIAHFKWINSK
jgi:hypothetical protein